VKKTIPVTDSLRNRERYLSEIEWQQADSAVYFIEDRLKEVYKKNEIFLCRSITKCVELEDGRSVPWRTSRAGCCCLGCRVEAVRRCSEPAHAG
jgi:hypothetical protein